MAFPVSPAVVVREFDVTTVVPAVALTPACLAGVFRWGPVFERVATGTETDVINRFHKPSNLNPETWFTAANFLAYGGELLIVRVGELNGTNAESFFAATNGNTVFTGNTSGINVGMILLYSNNEGAISPTNNGAVTVVSVNSTSVILSSPATNTAANVDLIFRTNKLYTSVAQETYNPRMSWSAQVVQNDHDYLLKDGTFEQTVQWIARFPGALGDSIRVAVCDTPSQWSSDTNLAPNAHFAYTNSGVIANVGSNTVTFTFTPADTANTTMVTSANVLAGSVHDALTIGDLVKVGNVTIGFELLKIDSVANVTVVANVFSFTVQTEENYGLSANVYSNTLSRFWEFAQTTGVSPEQSDFVLTNGNTAANDELHVVVVDQKGLFTGVPETVLETYKRLSRATDAVEEAGQSIYYKTVINARSKFIRWVNDRTTARSNTAQLIASSTATAPYSAQMYGGGDGLPESTIPIGTITTGYDMYSSAEDVDVGLVLTGKNRGTVLDSNTQLSTYLINNLAETRKDCVVFCSPDYNLVVNQAGEEATNIVAARNSMPSSSYGFMDSGYKLQYDRYNNVYRYIPLNGDVAGLAARTDQTNDPWWSFAGYNRGNIKNVIKLAWNPKLPDRNILYAADVNSVVTSPGLGTVLFGDKTLLHKPSAFNRINVRRLFITLEKAIATAAKFTLFEFNDDFTRAQFRAMVNPFLRDVEGRRGITDFLVVCDGTNNTPEVIVQNQFKAAIYIKPNYSINWVILDFVAVPPTVQFNEIVGNYGG